MVRESQLACIQILALLCETLWQIKLVNLFCLSFLICKMGV